MSIEIAEMLLVVSDSVICISEKNSADFMFVRYSIDCGFARRSVDCRFVDNSVVCNSVW